VALAHDGEFQQPVRDGRSAIELGLIRATTSQDGICCGSRNELLPRFRRRQVSAAIAWEAAVVAVIAIIVGVPRSGTTLLRLMVDKSRELCWRATVPTWRDGVRIGLA